MSFEPRSEYARKLLDPRWQKKRLGILNRDEFTCQQCGDTENTLHVHHRAYNRRWQPWEYPDAWLVTLCAPCHEQEKEDMEEALDDLILEFKLTFLANDLRPLIPALRDFRDTDIERHRYLSYVIAHFLRSPDLIKEADSDYEVKYKAANGVSYKDE